ncbi:MAG: hypothetical protein JSW58_01815 [Candidatus Latescibacterota bacterium]|nr:MAG: hypothetical protein JSW58_01815 [Candidatus Latescibacterota bacterium]
MRTSAPVYAAVILLLPIVSCDRSDNETGPGDGPADRPIGLYAGRGADEDCVEASRSMFKWMGHAVELLGPQSFQKQDLGKFKLLCFPGGDMYEYAQDISSTGKENIRTYVENGGAYIGICGGAYFASERVVWLENQLQMEPLRLYEGTARGPLNEVILYPAYGMCKIVFVESEHPITSEQPDSAWVLYYWGPALVPDDDRTVTILGRYDQGDAPAVLSFAYGDGRVFLIGAHPEFEEDDDRDGVTFGDELDDQGSDWDLMNRAVLWCLGE